MAYFLGDTWSYHNYGVNKAYSDITFRVKLNRSLLGVHIIPKFIITIRKTWFSIENVAKNIYWWDWASKFRFKIVPFLAKFSMDKTKSSRSWPASMELQTKFHCRIWREIVFVIAKLWISKEDACLFRSRLLSRLR